MKGAFLSSFRFLCAILFGFSLIGCQKPGVFSFRAKPDSLQQVRTFDALPLRGYGTLSGVLWESADKSSILQIDCEDEAKAKLIQAKFLSDLLLLPGVRPAELHIKGGTIHAIEAEDQGLISAIRIGRQVFIPAAVDQQALKNLIVAGFQGGMKDALSRAEVEVPMMLDRWDKFGFRFYYRPWELPADPALAKDYDITSEFDFAAKHDRIGLALWAKPSSMDTAEGLTDEDWWDWAAIAAADKKLPVGIQLGGGAGSQVWLLNRYRDEAAQKMPQFVGNYYSIASARSGNNTGWLSWCSEEGKDVQFGILQDIVRRMVKQGNVTSVLEPHGETRHGLHEVFLEYGPVADSSYQKFLTEKYGDLAKLNSAWGTSFGDWSDAHVPELASFVGWGDQALDLQGIWKIGYETPADGVVKTPKELLALGNTSVPTQPAPGEWFEETFDDSSWPELVAPGHDRQMFLPAQPAVFRRNFSVSAEWLAAHPRVWLYVWDLSKANKDSMKVVLNGKTVAQDPTDRVVPHWNAYEVTGQLREGANSIALRLPGSRLAYRIYLSPDAPSQYPDLGANGNAKWVDFIDWMAWARMKAVGRGMQMIRQATPDIQISMMHPDDYADDLKNLALSYGGNFHNTGYMSGFYADFLPSLMRGAGLPFTLEPGGPAASANELKNMLGLWSTEGLQGIDYFIHIGNVMWNPEIRSEFERQLALFRLIGKYHAPRTEIAALYSGRNKLLVEFPWKADPKTSIGSSYWKWNVRAVLRDRYESDGLTESSFKSGDAARYRVVVDTNTSIMDKPLLDEVEKYVRDGGVFVTFGHTGRHTSIEKDVWPIERLTGYQVTEIEQYGWNPRQLRLAENQEVFASDWTKPLNGKGLDGMKMKRVADDARDLLLWEDGSVAVGMRPLGKGFIIQVGCKFAERGLGDRMDPTKSGLIESPQIQALDGMLEGIFAWRGIAPIPVKWEPRNITILPRHFVSNNGLYDVWVAFNQSPTQSISGELTFSQDINPMWAIDVRDGARMDVKNHRLPLTLAPLETRAFLTPRHQIAQAPTEWFELQRSWWRGVTPVAQTPLPVPPHRFSLDLGPDWAFKPVSSAEEAAALCAKDVDDTGWERMRMGIWNLPNHRDVRHAVLRKTFEVPADWTNGETGLWLRSWFGRTFADSGRIWLDGKPLTEKLVNDGVTDANPGAVLKPGTRHVIAVEVVGKGSLNGSKGTAWLWFWPKPQASLDLGGQWQSTQPGDPLTPADEVTLPGAFQGMVLRRNIIVPADQKERRVVINVDSVGPVGNVVINGMLISRHHHLIGNRWQLDLTPWIRFGKENEIELINLGPGEIRDISLYFFDPDTSP